MRLLAAGLYLLLFAAVVRGMSTPEVLRAERYPDTDDYTRLLRVRTLVETGAWFDGGISRSNWPHGETLHWTRPVDTALLAVTGVAVPFAGFDRALAVAALVLPPLLLLATLAASAWGAAAVAGPTAWLVVPIFLLSQPAVLAYGRPGRPDHHALILLFLALSLGFLLRGLKDPGRRRWAVGLGVSAGIGLWASPEFLLALAIYLAVAMGLWITGGRLSARFHLTWTAALVSTLALALLVERGPGVLAVEYDRISVVHLLMAALSVGVWAVAAAWEGRHASGNAYQRAAVGLGSGLVAVAALWATFPAFYGGPMVEVTDPVVRAWLGQVRELQPTLFPDDTAGASLLLVNAGAAMVAIVFLALGMQRSQGDRGPRTLLLVGLAACLGLALVQIRWVTYVQLLAAPAVALMVASVATPRPRPGGGRDFRVLRATAVALGLVLGPLIAAAALSALGPAESQRAGGTGGSCDGEAISALLLDRFGVTPVTVAAHMDLGPVILYRTPYRVWATPYHRNQEGIRKAYDLFASAGEAETLARVRDTRPDVLVLCPDEDGTIFPGAREGRTTLFGRLVEGDVPAWLEEIPVPDGQSSVRVFAVDPGA